MPKIMQEGRCCRICGATLSIYNTDDICRCHSVSPKQHSDRMEMITDKSKVSLCCPGHVDRGFNRALREYNG